MIYLSERDTIAMIKFAVFMRTHSVQDSYYIALPSWFPKVYNGFTECDMAIGPCACGAWHKLDEPREIMVPK